MLTILKRNVESHRQKKIKKYLKEVLGLTGLGLIVSNIFNFSHTGVSEFSGGLSLDLDQRMIGVAYYYSDLAIALITIGTILLAISILACKKNEN